MKKKAKFNNKVVHNKIVHYPHDFELADRADLKGNYKAWNFHELGASFDYKDRLHAEITLDFLKEAHRRGATTVQQALSMQVDISDQLINPSQVLVLRLMSETLKLPAKEAADAVDAVKKNFNATNMDPKLWRGLELKLNEYLKGEVVVKKPNAQGVEEETIEIDPKKIGDPKVLSAPEFEPIFKAIRERFINSKQTVGYDVVKQLLAGISDPACRQEAYNGLYRTLVPNPTTDLPLAQRNTIVDQMLAKKGSFMYRELTQNLAAALDDSTRARVIQATRVYKPLDGFPGNYDIVLEGMRNVVKWREGNDPAKLWSALESVVNKVAVMKNAKAILENNFSGMSARESLVANFNDLARHAINAGLKVVAPGDNDNIQPIFQYSQKEQKAYIQQGIAHRNDFNAIFGLAGAGTRFGKGTPPDEGGPYASKSLLNINGLPVELRGLMGWMSADIEQLAAANSDKDVAAIRQTIKDHFKTDVFLHPMLNNYAWQEQMALLSSVKCFDILGEKMSFFDLVGYNNPKVTFSLTNLSEQLIYKDVSELKYAKLYNANGTEVDVTAPSQTQDDIFNSERGHDLTGYYFDSADKEKRNVVVVYDHRETDGMMTVGEVDLSSQIRGINHSTQKGHEIVDQVQSRILGRRAAEMGTIAFHLDFTDQAKFDAWLNGYNQVIPNPLDHHIGDVHKAIYGLVKDQYNGKAHTAGEGIQVLGMHETLEQTQKKLGAKYHTTIPVEDAASWLYQKSDYHFLRLGYLVDHPESQMAIMPQAGAKAGGWLGFDNGKNEVVVRPVEGAEAAGSMGQAYLELFTSAYKSNLHGSVNANLNTRTINASSFTNPGQPANWAANSVLVRPFIGVSGENDQYVTVEDTTVNSMRHNMGVNFAIHMLWADLQLAAIKALPDKEKAVAYANFQDAQTRFAAEYPLSMMPIAQAGFKGSMQSANFGADLRGWHDTKGPQLAQTIAASSTGNVAADKAKDIVPNVTVNMDNLPEIKELMTYCDHDTNVTALVLTVKDDQEKAALVKYLNAQHLLKSDAQFTVTGHRFKLDDNLQIITLPQAPARDEKTGSIRVKIDALEKKVLNQLPAEIRGDAQSYGMIRDFLVKLVSTQPDAVKTAADVQATVSLIKAIFVDKNFKGMDEGNLKPIQKFGLAGVLSGISDVLDWNARLLESEQYKKPLQTGKGGMYITIEYRDDNARLADYARLTLNTDSANKLLEGGAKLVADMDNPRRLTILVENDIDTGGKSLDWAVQQEVRKALLNYAQQAGLKGADVLSDFANGKWKYDVTGIVETDSIKAQWTPIPLSVIEPAYQHDVTDQEFEVKRDHMIQKIANAYGVLYSGKVLGATDTFKGNLISLMSHTDPRLIKVLLGMNGSSRVDGDVVMNASTLDTGVNQIKTAQSMGTKLLDMEPVLGAEIGALLNQNGDASILDRYRAAGAIVNVSAADAPAVLGRVMAFQGKEQLRDMVVEIKSGEKLKDTDMILVDNTLLNRDDPTQQFMSVAVLRTKFPAGEVGDQDFDDYISRAKYKLAAEVVNPKVFSYAAQAISFPNQVLNRNVYNPFGDLGHSGTGMPMQNNGFMTAMQDHVGADSAHIELLATANATVATANKADIQVVKPRMDGVEQQAGEAYLQTATLVSILQGKTPELTDNTQAWQANVGAFSTKKAQVPAFTLAVDGQGNVTSTFTTDQRSKSTALSGELYFDPSSLKVANSVAGLINGTGEMATTAERVKIVAIKSDTVTEKDINYWVTTRNPLLPIGSFELENGAGNMRVKAIEVSRDTAGNLQATLVVEKNTAKVIDRPLNLATHAGEQNVLALLYGIISHTTTDHDAGKKLNTLFGLDGATQMVSTSRVFVENLLNMVDSLKGRATYLPEIDNLGALSGGNTDITVVAKVINRSIANIASAEDRDALMARSLTVANALLANISHLNGREQAELLVKLVNPLAMGPALIPSGSVLDSTVEHLVSVYNNANTSLAAKQAAFDILNELATLRSAGKVNFIDNAGMQSILEGTLGFDRYQEPNHFPADMKFGFTKLIRGASREVAQDAADQLNTLTHGNRTNFSVFAEGYNFTAFRSGSSPKESQKLTENDIDRYMFIRAAEGLGMTAQSMKVFDNGTFVQNTQGVTSVDKLLTGDAYKNVRLTRDDLAGLNHAKMANLFTNVEALYQYRALAVMFGHNPDDYRGLGVVQDQKANKLTFVVTGLGGHFADNVNLSHNVNLAKGMKIDSSLQQEIQAVVSGPAFFDDVANLLHRDTLQNFGQVEEKDKVYGVLSTYHQVREVTERVVP